ncbi:MAG: PQQ-binding-like beta-propeller repeat protein, partial [Gammaproteobacteria bacterium]
MKGLSIFTIIISIFSFVVFANADSAKEILEATGVKGGLIVHVGCGDGKLAAAIGKSDGYLVQGLERSEEKLDAARKHVQDLGLYGHVSISYWDGKRLPYVDNLVNLLICEEDSKPRREEIIRVLAPEGVAYIKSGDKWDKIVKPRPDEIDDWTHYMYDAGGNAVSHDTVVGPPKHLQWVGGPRWARHHDHMASMSAMVSAGNRVFYIFDEGSTASIMLPSKWALIARDAFSGVVLWKQRIPHWWTRFHPLKSGPAQFPRRLVAEADHVYATLEINGPVTQLDAATGKILKSYKASKGTEEIIFCDGLLFVVVGPPRIEEEEVMRHRYENEPQAAWNPDNFIWEGWEREIIAIKPETGKVEWRLSSTVMPNTLAANADSVFFHNGESIVCVEKTTGQQQWGSKPVATCKAIPSCFAPTLVVVDGTVVYAGGDKYAQHMDCVTDTMTGLRAADGKILWTAAHPPSGYQSPEDVLVIDKTVWTPTTTGWGNTDLMTGVDLQTGKIISEFMPDVKDPSWFIHHRCYPGKATVNYLLMSLEGVEFVDPKKEHWQIHHWIRGECTYGVMPANGLLYTPMHPCACSADMKLNGLNAVAAAEARTRSTIDTSVGRLTKGTAYGKITGEKNITSGDWPTFRRNPSRNGVASCDVPSSIRKSWVTDVGGRLSAPVVAGGQLYVASIDRHTLHVLDADSGQRRWSFTAGGRIDSPPTIYKGMVLFGSMDGCVYCLRTSDGSLVWRFRPVQAEQNLVAWEQVESVWPVHGNILIRNDEAWFVAGRSVFLDGGLRMFRLEPKTGKVIAQITLDGKAEDGGDLTGKLMKDVIGLPDVLSSEGSHVFMRGGVFRENGDAIEAMKEKLPHLFCSYGFLDDSWFHRSYWLFGDNYAGRAGYSRTGKKVSAGRILVYDDDAVYGFGRQQKYFSWTTPMEYRLFAEARQDFLTVANEKEQRRKATDKKGGKAQPEKNVIWEINVPILASGLVLAGDTLFAAGAPDVFDETQEGARDKKPEVLKAINEQDAALAGERGGILIAASKKDGQIKDQYDLEAPPVFDGLIAANGRLYVSLKNGTVQCWEKSPDGAVSINKRLPSENEASIIKVPRISSEYINVYKPAGSIFDGPSTKLLVAGKYYEEWVANDHCFIQDRTGRWHAFGITHPQTGLRKVHEGEHQSFHAIAPAGTLKRALKEGSWKDQPKVL